MDREIQIPDDFIYMTSEPETKNNEFIAMTDNEAAIFLLNELNDKYNICICEGNKYMKVNHIWINDEKLI
jgi:hypothetical protein